MRVTKECSIFWVRSFAGINQGFTVNLPAGLRVKPTDHGLFFLDEFPTSYPGKDAQKYTSFPIDSFNRHDATHYGIRLTAEQTKESD